MEWVSHNLQVHIFDFKIHVCIHTYPTIDAIIQVELFQHIFSLPGTLDIIIKCLGRGHCFENHVKA